MQNTPKCVTRLNLYIDYYRDDIVVSAMTEIRGSTMLKNALRTGAHESVSIKL